MITISAAGIIILILIVFIIGLVVGVKRSPSRRAMDALHAACALHWNANLFVSSDQRQIQAAQNAGLTVRFI